MLLNSREIASLFWTGTLIVFALVKSEDGRIWKALGNVMSAFFVRPILVSVLLAELWIVLVVFLLAEIGFWSVSDLKTTIQWALTFAFVTMFDIVRITEDNTYFRKTIRDSAGATAVIMFIAESYTFPLPVELLLVPLMTILVCMHALAQTDRRYDPANKLLTPLLGMAACGYIGYGLYQIATNSDQFFNLGTAHSFLLPIVLTMGYLPFVYLLNVHATYDRVSTRVHFVFRDQALERYAIWRAFLSFRFDLDGLRRWKRNLHIRNATSKGDIRSVIREVKRLQHREQNPPEIDPAIGWSPYEATSFMASESLKTDDYHFRYDDLWGADAKPLNIGDQQFMADNVAYHISGTEQVASELKLILNVNNIEQAESSDTYFYGLCQILLAEAGMYLDPDSVDVFRDAESFDLAAEQYQIRLKRDEFTGKIEGYTRTFTVRVPTTNKNCHKTDGESTL